MALPSLSRSLQREVVAVALMVGIAVSARSSLADHYVVPTGSMLPTVQLKDHVLVDKLAYGLRLPLADSYAVHFAAPALGDVVVLRSPTDGTVLLKRVVAVPGDLIAVDGGKLTIDGKKVPVVERGGDTMEQLGAGDHPLSLALGGGPDFGPTQLPKDRFLVMGDNRGNSLDGRSFGLVERDAILGRVEGVIVRHGAPTWVALSP